MPGTEKLRRPPPQLPPQAADDPRHAIALGRSIRLAELLAARLCHDISGSLGTVVNAIELANQDPASLQEALQLAEEASGWLGHQLRMLRSAWAGVGEPMDIADLLGMAAAMPSMRRLRIDGSALEAGVRFRPDAARLILNLFILATESLPRGGRLALAGHPAREIVVMIEGPQAAWPSDFGACLLDEEVAWRSLEDARTVVGPLIALMARDQGAHLSFLFSAAATAEGPPPLLIRLPQE